MSGSESPGQAMEAEEIVKQLDMEQVEEIPTSTATCAPLCPSTMSSVAMRLPPPLHTQTLEEEDELTHADLPPLTGEEK